jgi:hypothetical protein
MQKYSEFFLSKVLYPMLLTFLTTVRVSTHYALFGRSLVCSCFISCLQFKYTFFLVFLLKLYNLQKHENTKTLTYSQKVQCVLAFYLLFMGTHWCCQDSPCFSCQSNGNMELHWIKVGVLQLILLTNFFLSWVFP